VLFLAAKRGLSINEIDQLLNKKSGLLGVSGKSNDVRELMRLMRDGDEDATLALELFCNRLKKYVGAYMAVLGRVDAIVFTAGIGENNPWIRAKSVEGMEPLGVTVDAVRNEAVDGTETRISPDGSPIQVLVIPTDEELTIAKDTFELAG
jgi:acetate kinase